MGILDHARTWHIRTSAAPTDCVRAVAECLGGRNSWVRGSSWNVTMSGDNGTRTAVASYRGRTGIANAVTALSSRSQSEHDAALGSELTFVATAGRDGTTTCSMAMTQTAKVWLFFTADARFFRSAMYQVTRKLRVLDGGLTVVKQ